ARLFERVGISRAPVSEDGEVIGRVRYNNLVITGMVREDG
ncbi:CBS domain-containing protein, partial [Vibrio parahaemolyticus]|nr:CBS domain-containing protein [Vibrio parahaemolyticus]